MGDINYLAEQETIKEDAHLHHWQRYIFSSWDNTFLGLMCRDCDKFISEEDVAQYVNELEKKLKDAKRTIIS